jgi:Arylsulfatase A and related enzymes
VQVSILESVSGKWWLLVALAIVGIGFMVLLWRYRRQTTAGAILFLVILSPLILVNSIVVVWLRHKNPPPAERALVSSPIERTRREGPRVVWIIFDELQEQAVFENRPSGYSLPELDRFAQQSIHVDNAYPPSGFTLTSIPSLVMGEFVESATPVSQSELELKTKSGPVLWSRQPSVFSQARAEGFSTGLVGWFHPYCRLFAKDLDACYWDPQLGVSNRVATRLTFLGGLTNHVRVAVLRIPFLYRLIRRSYEQNQRRLQRQDHLAALEAISTNANTVLGQKLDLTYIHLPVPHGPWINESTDDPLSLDGYLNNVKAGDHAFGRLRQSMEATGDWDKSIVLVSADHWWRDAPKHNGRRDHRIPFLLKLADQKAGIACKGPFNTVLTRELVLKLLRGEMKTPSEVAEWIERNSPLGESSLTVNAP